MSRFRVQNEAAYFSVMYTLLREYDQGDRKSATHDEVGSFSFVPDLHFIADKRQVVICKLRLSRCSPVRDRIRYLASPTQRCNIFFSLKYHPNSLFQIFHVFFFSKPPNQHPNDTDPDFNPKPTLLVKYDDEDDELTVQLYTVNLFNTRITHKVDFR